MGQIITGEALGRDVHQLDDRLIGARMLGWMTEECKGANWWVCAATGDGKMIEWDSTALGHYSPDKAQKHYATRILSALHSLECDGGTWLVSWIDNCKRLHLVFKDHDGDIQTCIDSDKSWLIIREWDMDVWKKMATAAIDGWQSMEAVVEISDSQRYKLAAGESRLHSTDHGARPRHRRDSTANRYGGFVV